MEVWKDIKGFEGRYQISNYGNVKSVERDASNGTGVRHINEMIIKQAITKRGYLKVRIKDSNGKKVSLNVHREVAYAFIPKQDGKNEINHIDGNKQNNHVDNLEWVTTSENQLHAVKNGLKKPIGTKVRQMTLDGELVKIWNSHSDIKKSGLVTDWKVRKLSLEGRQLINGFLWENIN